MRIRSPLALWLALLALLSPLLATAPVGFTASTDVAEIASELKAAFGDAAVLCAHADDAAGGGAPEHHRGHCDDCCPLCRAGAGVLALWVPPPDPPALRVERRPEPIEPTSDFVPRERYRTAYARARAPPLEA
jgi:hypothetical protein